MFNLVKPYDPNSFNLVKPYDPNSDIHSVPPNLVAQIHVVHTVSIVDPIFDLADSPQEKNLTAKMSKSGQVTGV